MISVSPENREPKYISAKEPYRGRGSSSLYSDLYSEIVEIKEEEIKKRETEKKSFEDSYLGFIERLRRYNTEPIKIYIKDYEFVLPHALKNIVDAISESKYLLELEEDWDDEGANVTTFETYKNAVDFVITSSKFLNNYNSKLEKPFIDITRDGSISVQWDTPKASFFIIFKKNNKEYAYYYGQEKETQIGFKYRIK